MPVESQPQNRRSQDRIFRPYLSGEWQRWEFNFREKRTETKGWGSTSVILPLTAFLFHRALLGCVPPSPASSPPSYTPGYTTIKYILTLALMSRGFYFIVLLCEHRSDTRGRDILSHDRLQNISLTSAFDIMVSQWHFRSNMKVPILFVFSEVLMIPQHLSNAKQKQRLGGSLLFPTVQDHSDNSCYWSPLRREIIIVHGSQWPGRKTELWTSSFLALFNSGGLHHFMGRYFYKDIGLFCFQVVGILGLFFPNSL